MVSLIKIQGALCPFCLEEKVYGKQNYDSKLICKECNKFIPDDMLIRIPFKLFQEKKSLQWYNKYEQKLDEFREKIREQGKVGDVYIEIDMEVK